MPKPKTQYEELHQRTICPGCQNWVLWYRDKKGKKVYGCRIGVIPDRDQCSYRRKK